MRDQLVKFRTMQTNSLRGLLTGYGEVMGKGRPALDKAIPGVLERLVDRLPTMLIDTLREQWNGLAELDKHRYGEPVRILVCRGHETITEITSYDRSNCDQEEQEPEGAEAIPR
jgi:hypothetical protein